MIYMKKDQNQTQIVNRQEIGKRILEERSRLGLTQSALADMTGSSRVSIVKYESGATLPSAEALVAFDQVGFDVRYVLRGLKSDERSVIRDRFRRAFEEVSRQEKVNRERLSDEVRLELTWRIYDAFAASEGSNDRRL